ncbi:hypothetical protein GIB67_020211 [Kingdonia uniflora]|uniref:Disease resistance protein At4g27190-like leucine-rich repeats domain-containing protein n=1 Tax=Kingdonia uniflora TaxID=39325 RepID=A0A7J7P1S3_9MAGN|nr:hypothetical protein GIB67_020211 [Kingdonia uniflora]
MTTTKNIDVKVLSKNDSLELFRREVGDVDSDALREMFDKIVNECDGLPLAIVTLARTLRKEDKHFWDAVIPQLRKSMCEEMDIVNASIKMSYNFLKSSETKLCFLLCALFPEDHKVTMDVLVGYTMGEGLLGEVETLSEARGNLHIMVDTLVSSGLLLKGDDEGYVIMHDIVRDAAISIARENESESIMYAGLGLQKWPKLKEAGKCLRLSLMSNDIHKVPADVPECSQLMTLSLASSKSLRKIPDGFFEGMKRLVTLDLSKDSNNWKSLLYENATHSSIAEEAEGMEINSSPIFSNRKRLEIRYCHGLKCIFPIRIFQGLMQLKEDDSKTILLPCLRIVELWDLSRLTSFFSHSKRLPHVLFECPFLERIEIQKCPNLKRLPFGPKSIPKLEKFLIDDDRWFESLEWDDFRVNN